MNEGIPNEEETVRLTEEQWEARQDEYKERSINAKLMLTAGLAAIAIGSVALDAGENIYKDHQYQEKQTQAYEAYQKAYNSEISLDSADITDKESQALHEIAIEIRDEIGRTPTVAEATAAEKLSVAGLGNELRMLISTMKTGPMPSSSADSFAYSAVKTAYEKRNIELVGELTQEIGRAPTTSEYEVIIGFPYHGKKELLGNFIAKMKNHELTKDEIYHTWHKDLENGLV